MRLSRIRFAFPWRIALILAFLPCLPLLGFLAWFESELPPLQRYYLAAYWHSSKTANQPDALTQIQWLMETAPGRKRHWLFAFDVAEGSQNDLPLALSSAAAEQGWTGIERTPAESMDSTELEKLLREDFYGGKTFRQLMNEPLVYGVATWVFLAGAGGLARVIAVDPMARLDDAGQTFDIEVDEVTWTFVFVAHHRWRRIERTQPVHPGPTKYAADGGAAEVQSLADPPAVVPQLAKSQNLF